MWRKGEKTCFLWKHEDRNQGTQVFPDYCENWLVFIRCLYLWLILQMFQAVIYSPPSPAHPSFPRTLYSWARRWIVIIGRTADERGDENMSENDREGTMDLDVASVLDWLCLLRFSVCHLMAIFNASFLADWVNSCLEEETAPLMKAQLNQQQRAGGWLAAQDRWWKL